MTSTERDALRAAVREVRRKTAILDRANAAAATAKRNLQDTYDLLDRAMPHGDPTVLRFGNQTLVVQRRQGVGKVEIVPAAVV